MDEEDWNERSENTPDPYRIDRLTDEHISVFTPAHGVTIENMKAEVLTWTEEDYIP